MDKNIQKQFFHWVWGENKIREDEPTYLINLELAVSIRFDYSKGMFSSYEEFFNKIADVQFLNGNRPNKDEVTFILTEAWNYMVIEERILDNDLEDFN
tara:strand:- start:219 stop:512 length:294 start_codon:yes stop_codon:yes gene_type:complete